MLLECMVEDCDEEGIPRGEVVIDYPGHDPIKVKVRTCDARHADWLQSPTSVVSS